MQGMSFSSDSGKILSSVLINSSWNEVTHEITSTSSKVGTYVHQFMKIGFIGKI